MTIRAAYSKRPDYQRAFRDVIGALTEEQLAMRPLGLRPTRPITPTRP